MKGIKQKAVKTFPTIFLYVFVFAISRNQLFISYLFHGGTKKDSFTRALSLPVISSSQNRSVHGYFFIHLSCFFFSPSWYPKQCPGSIILCMSLFLLLTLLYFFAFSKINSSIASEWVFYQLAFAGKIFSCLIQNNDFFHLSRGLLINATSGVTTFSGVCFRGTRGLSEILAKLNHNQRENVSNQNYTLGFNLLPWKSQGWHFYSIFRYSQMGCSLQDNFCRPSAFSQGNKAAKSSKSKSEASILFIFFVGVASGVGGFEQLSVSYVVIDIIGNLFIC